MAKAKPIVRTESGNPITRNPARVEYAAERLREMTYNKARQAIMEHWGVSLGTASRDIAAARQLIGLELDVVSVRAVETRRNERLADRAEELSEKAASDSDWNAAANLQRVAVAASREVARLVGACAPARVDVVQSASVDVELRVDLVLERLEGILPPHLYQAWMQCLELIAEAQEAGAFRGLEAAPEVVDDELDDQQN